MVLHKEQYSNHFSSEGLSEIEMMFQENICLYSEHWYQFEGQLAKLSILH